MDQKTVVRLGFVAAAAFQIILLMIIVVPKERTLATGQTVVLQTVPVDPRDLFRGDYVVLRYEISTLPNYDCSVRGETVYTSLEKRGSVWLGSVPSGREPSEGVFIKGRVTDDGFSPDDAVPCASVKITVEYGIESYFVPEGTGHIIERARDVKVKVAINSSGGAVIKELLVDGQPFDPSVTPGPR